MDLGIHLLDITICTLFLRIGFGWLVAYPRLIRLILTLILLGLFIIGAYQLQLPFASGLVLIFLVPALVFLFLSFVPELSRIYHAALRGQLFRTRPPVSSELIEIMAETIWEMSSRKRGALLVFPGREDPESQISGGEEVDMKVNRSLISSVLNPHSPRHDGAVIIRGDRIVRIGAVLPLASAEDNAADLGTRHLAALGLSERSDSHIVVVSEEKGTISLAHNGKLERLHLHSEDAVAGMLRRRLGLERDRQHVLLSQAFSLGLWLISLVIAVQGSIVAEDIRQRIIDPELPPVVLVQVSSAVEFQVANVPDGTFIDLSSVKDTEFSVLMRLPADVEVPSSLVAELDLEGKEPGRIRLNLLESMLKNFPENGEVVGFEPQRVEFTLGTITERSVKVKVPKVVGLKEGLVLREVELLDKELELLVRDAKWRQSSVEAFDVDLSKVEQAGTFEFKTELDVPASVEPKEESLREGVRVKVVIEKLNEPEQPAPATP